MEEICETPFPYSLSDEEIVNEIVNFAKTYEKWPITNIGYVSRFHDFHKSNPHYYFTTASHQRGVLIGRNRSLERSLEELRSIKSGLKPNKTRMERLSEHINWIHEEIEDWESKVIVSEEQYNQFLSIYARTRIKAQEVIDSLLEEIMESQKKDIIHYSRELCIASLAIGKKSVTHAQVRDYVNNLSTPLIVPDSRNVLYARANFIIMGLRE